MPLEIVEASSFAVDESGRKVEAIDVRSIVAQQSVTVGSPSSAFDAKTRVLRLHATEALRVEFGVSPSADANSAFRMAADQTEYVSVRGSGWQLDTAAG